SVVAFVLKSAAVVPVVVIAVLVPLLIARLPVEVMAPLPIVPAPVMLPLASRLNVGLVMKLVNPVLEPSPKLTPLTVPPAFAVSAIRLLMLVPLPAAEAADSLM